MRLYFTTILVMISIGVHSQLTLPPGTSVLQPFSNGTFRDSILIVKEYTISGTVQCRLDEETHWTRTIH